MTILNRRFRYGNQHERYLALIAPKEKMAIDQEEQWSCPKEKAERIISLGERILLESTDTQLRKHAIQRLCYTYNSIGDTENALRYAYMGGSIWATRENFWACVLKGAEGVEPVRIILFHCFILLQIRLIKC